jgi:hypothetical protein
MRTSPPAKAVIVALAAGAWVLRTDPDLGHTLAIVAGAALFTFAWLRRSAQRGRVMTPPANELAAGGGSAHPHIAAQQRISRTHAGRGARDLRCPATRVPTRARRSSRRY